MKKISLNKTFLILYIIIYLLHMKIYYANYILLITFALYLLFSLKKIIIKPKYFIIIGIFSFAYLLPSLLSGNLYIGLKNILNIILYLSPLIIYIIESKSIGKDNFYTKVIPKIISLVLIYIFIVSYIFLSKDPYFARIMANHNYNIPGIDGIGLVTGGGYFIIYGLIFLSILFLSRIRNNTNSSQKLKNIILYILTGLLIFKANFATAFILFMLATVIYIFINSYKKFKFFNILLSIIAIFLAVNYQYVFSVITEFIPEDSIIYIRLNDAVNDTENSTFSERFMLMKRSIATIKDNFFFGISHKYKYNYDLMKSEAGLHTEWIDVLAKYGIIVFLLYAYIIYKVLKNIILKYKNTQYYHVFLTSAIMLAILGFLNPISNTGCLGIIFVVMPLLMGEIKNEKEVL